MPHINKPLVISMGFNGYQWKWKRAIASHRVYCNKHGYDYVFVNKPVFTTLLMECAWLKIPLIISALSSGREWVLFVDSDAAISERCPPLESVSEPDKSIYMVKGVSGRVNSGMILIHNSPSILALLKTILSNALSPIPTEDDVGWGENGHVIHYTKHFSGLKILGTEWNNTKDVDLQDYIRHFCAGIMRTQYTFTRAEIIYGKICGLYTKSLRKLKGESPPALFYDQLDGLMKIVSANHTVFPYLSKQDMCA